MGLALSKRLISFARSGLAKKAGVNVARAEVASDGKIVLVLKKDGEAPSISECNEWDEIDGAD
jgi:hypothetical protein